MPEIGKWEATTQLTVLTGDITTTNNQNLELVPNGTGITQIGDAGVTSQGLDTNDDLYISGRLEVDGGMFIDGFSTFAVGSKWKDNMTVWFGDDSDAGFFWGIGQANDALMWPIRCGTAASSGNVIMCEHADRLVNFGHPIATNPTFYIQSADATVPAKYLKFYHDGLNGQIHCGSGRLDLESEASDIKLSAISGIVYVHTSAANSALQVFNAAGTDYVEVTRTGLYGLIDTNTDPLRIRGAAGVNLQETRGFGMRIPTAIPASPAAGSMYFDVATNVLYCHNGTAWVGVTLT